MSKHKILIQGNYGCPGQLTDECIKFIKSKGKKYPDILGNRHDPVLIEMFEKFAEDVKINDKFSRKILYTKPFKDMSNYRGYYLLTEIEGDLYCIQDYDGAESAYTPKDFKWVKIKSK